jgi:uncharacterized protein (TIGR02444 family)
MNFPNSEFWNYSTQTYQLPEVADTCLHLQNTCGADVNILLFCCWMGEKGVLLCGEDMQSLQGVSSPWQSAVLKPLREARQMMKHQIIAMPAELHAKTLNNLAEMEINAEHMEQMNLEKAIDLNQRPTCTHLPAIDISARNLMLYAQQLEGTETAAGITQLLKQVYGDDEAVLVAMMAASA